MACVDCGQEFTFTAGEQEFYAQRGFTESPKRCPSCRQIRKAQRSRDGGGSRNDSYGGREGGNGGYGDTSYASSDFGGYSASGGYSAGGGGGGGGGYSSGGGGYGSGGGGGYSERRPREMFEAVCANCGRTASVPFRPSGSKPVYCSDCFESRR